MLNTKYPIRSGQLRASTSPLFSFVVVSDTHINERDDVSSSPCETNRFANDRARYVFQDIASMEPPPKFVLHLGDIVHPVPSVPTFSDAVDRFWDVVSPLRVPLYVLPGNHDVGDKRIDWMPADQVCDSYLKKYREAFGKDYFSFEEGNLRFILINSLLLNSGLSDEENQRKWLEEQISTASGKRIFLFMHYPPYIHTVDERGSYDNIDEPARSWLLEKIRNPVVEAVFAGHVHNFWYDSIGAADFYMLPSTAFLRHDFTEFYRVAPSNEFGRGDVEKFGYFIVDVYADGHVAYSVRTHGRKISEGDSLTSRRQMYLAHPKTSTFDSVGVELRHPWTESMQITATGGVQEFGRKWARNDYPLLALWEMGVRLSKIPDVDFKEAESRSRMRLMARQGQHYIVTCLGKPRISDNLDELQTAGVIAVEVNATLKTYDLQKDSYRDWRKNTGTQLFLSKIHTYDDSHFDGKHFSHFVKAGFDLNELEGLQQWITGAIDDGSIDGITVRVEADQDLVSAGIYLASFAEKTKSLVLASIKTSGINLATERADDREMVARTAQAMVLSKTSQSVRYIFDTFMDVDRGYFPRHAFIDRRFDLRPAATTFSMLNSLLSSEQKLIVRPSDGGFSFNANDHTFQLIDSIVSKVLELFKIIPTGTIVYDLVANTCSSLDDYISNLVAEMPSTRLVLLLQIS